MPRSKPSDQPVGADQPTPQEQTGPAQGGDMSVPTASPLVEAPPRPGDEETTGPHTTNPFVPNPPPEPEGKPRALPAGEVERIAGLAMQARERNYPEETTDGSGRSWLVGPAVVSARSVLMLSATAGVKTREVSLDTATLTLDDARNAVKQLDGLLRG